MSNRSQAPSYDEEPSAWKKARVKSIYQAVADARMDMLPWSAAQQHGMTEQQYQADVHNFAQTFLWGLEYALWYPQRAASIVRDKREGGDNDARYVDHIAWHLLKLWTRGEKPEVDFDQLTHIAQTYTEHSADPQPVAPTFDEKGRLVWEDTNGKLPFPTYHETEETWDEV